MQLDGKHAARDERLWSEGQQTAIDVEAIDATGEGELGLVVCDLFGKLAHHVVGNVGRIRDKHGERAHELGRHAGGEVALHDVDGIRQAKRVAVLTRKGGRRGRDVRCRDERAGPLARDGAAHTAGTAANLEHTDRAHRARGVNALERGIHEQLRLRTWDEDARRAGDVDEAKARLAGDVLERLALGAALDEAVHAGELVGGQRLVEGHIETRAVLARGGAEQPLGREARMFVTLVREIVARPGEAAVYRPDVLF